MSMSTLGQQLAAINAGGQNFGATLATSRRHEDAVGRGMLHSVQYGHSISTKSHLFKPSIIHEDAKKAADVPLTTVRENCISSLHQLTKHDGGFERYVGQLCSGQLNERGLLTPAENEKLDKVVGELLDLLSTRLDSKSTLAPCLHVVEFLLRQHEIHVRPRCASRLLLAFMPFHEEPYFLRLLQLINLAEMPMWSFLRPYSVPGSHVARPVFVKQSTKDTAILREMCRLAHRCSKLANSGRTLSFTAAVLVEAMSMQKKTLGSIDEKSCLVILTQASSACRQRKSSAYLRNWGHVVASTLVECCVLAEEPRQTLAESVLKGIIASDGATRANGLIVAYTILSQPLDNPNDESLLEIAGSTPAGVVLGKSVLHALLKIDDIASCLGTLFHDEGFTQISDLISSLVVMAWKRVIKKSKADKREQSLKVVNNLVREPKLASLWRNIESRWTASIIHFLISSSIKQDTEELPLDHPLLAILPEIRLLSTRCYDEGIALALRRTNASNREKLASYLGVATSDHENDALPNSSILPPRVALEHSDSAVRLAAIPIAISESQQGDPGEEDGESLPEALLRHFCTEDISVAVSFGRALVTTLNEISEISAGFIEKIPESLRRWGREALHDSEESKAIHTILFDLASIGLSYCVSPMESKTLSRNEIIEAIGIHLRGPYSDQCAACLLGTLRGRKKAVKSHKLNDCYIALLSDERLDEFVRRKIDGKVEAAIRFRFAKVLLRGWSVLAKDNSKRRSSLSEPGLMKRCFEFSVWIMMSFHPMLTSSDFEEIKDCLVVASEGMEADNRDIAHHIHHLATFPSDIFRDIGAPAIEKFCHRVENKQGIRVSKLSVLAELAYNALTESSRGNIITLLLEFIPGSDMTEAAITFFHAVAFLLDGNENVRTKAFDIISAIGSLKGGNRLSSQVLSLLCQKIVAEKSDMVVSPAQTLGNTFSSVFGSGEGASLAHRKEMLMLCISSLLCYDSNVSDTGSLAHVGWLPFGVGVGGYNAIALVLGIFERCGEHVFPLELRWEMAGIHVLEYVIQHVRTSSSGAEELTRLIKSSVRMLTGSLVVDSNTQARPPSIIISSGPGNHGGRQRSYSLGSSDTSDHLKPYPTSMTNKICEILEGPDKAEIFQEIKQSLINDVLSTQFWAKKVFSELPKTEAMRIVEALLNCAAEDGTVGAESALFALPLKADQVESILKKNSKNDSFVSYMADYVVSNASILGSSDEMESILVALFDALRKNRAASCIMEDATSSEFAAHSLLSAIAEVAQCGVHNGNLSGISPRFCAQLIDFLATLLSIEEDRKVKNLGLPRSHQVALTIVREFGVSHAPNSFTSVVSTILAAIERAMKIESLALAMQVFNTLVPVLFANRTVEKEDAYRIMNLLLSLLAANRSNAIAKDICFAFAQSLPGSVEGDFSPVGLLSCILNAGPLKDEESGDFLSALSLDVLHAVPLGDQARALVTVMDATIESLTHASEDKVSSMKSSIIRKAVEDLVDISDPQSSTSNKRATKQPSQRQRRLLVTYASSLQNIAYEIVQQPEFGLFVEAGSEAAHEIALLLWQKLLVIQTACFMELSRDDVTDDTEWLQTAESAQHVMDEVLNALPVPVFLASATAMIDDAGNADIRSRAIRLVSQRLQDFDESTPEMGLFADMVPHLLKLVEKTKESRMVHQACLITVENISRKTLLGSSSFRGPERERLLPLCTRALETCVRLSTRICLDGKKPKEFKFIDASDLQLVFASNICAATMVRISGASALQMLPKIIEVIMYILSSTRLLVASDAHNNRDQIDLAQCSALRCLLSVVESLPQFLSPYLKGLLYEISCLACAVQSEGNGGVGSVSDLVTRVEMGVAGKVPVRQLVPAVSGTILDSSDSAIIENLLGRMRSSIDAAPGVELLPLRGPILSACTRSFDVCDIEDSLVLQKANDAFLSLVLKLSEIQLKPLYAKLHEWAGAFDGSDGYEAAVAKRRHAFWALSATLSSELKSIFHSCLNAVLRDAVDELERLAHLTVEKKSITPDRKKQKVEAEAVTMMQMAALKPMLSCLEAAFQADAHEGGEWIRSDDAGLYHMFLGPLQKLLFIDTRKILGPPGGDAKERVLTYKDVVMEKDEDGSVTSCLVALASAAGDEQLWKPLNYAVMEACGHERRAEVRKGGIACLLSLIRSLGEEYMVLIPECLPVISELLEDPDEETAAIAQQCVELSEELLGESLQDKL